MQASAAEKTARQAAPVYTPSIEKAWAVGRMRIVEVVQQRPKSRAGECRQATEAGKGVAEIRGTIHARKPSKGLVGLDSILLVIAIQLVALLAPLAAGIAGLIPGGVAGLVSILAWAGFGLPVSYGIIDRIQATEKARRARLAAARRHARTALTS